MAIAYTPVDAQPCRFPPDPSPGNPQEAQKEKSEAIQQPFLEGYYNPCLGLSVDTPGCYNNPCVYHVVRTNTGNAYFGVGL